MCDLSEMRNVKNTEKKIHYSATPAGILTCMSWHIALPCCSVARLLIKASSIFKPNVAHYKIQKARW